MKPLLILIGNVLGAILLGLVIGKFLIAFAFGPGSYESKLSKRCTILLSLIEMQQQLIQDLERRVERLEKENTNGLSYPPSRPAPRIDSSTDHRVYYRPQAP